MAGTMLFVAGFAAVFTSYGSAFGVVGTVQATVTKVLGIVTIFLGLMFAGSGQRIPFVLAAAGAQRAFRLFAAARRHAPTVMRIGGSLLIVVGPLEITGLWTALTARPQVLVVSWQPPL